MSWLKPAQLAPAYALGATLLAPGCGNGGYDQGPASSHPYPPPGDFGEVSTSGGSSAPDSDVPDKDPRCSEQRNTWTDWEQSFAPGISSPLAAFASVDHEIKTPLHWSPGPANGGQLSWNVAGQHTHLTVQLSVDPQETGRSPVFVASRPFDLSPFRQIEGKVKPTPQGHTPDCPSHWELPVSLRVSTQDLALKETRIPGILQVGSGGVSRLIATIPAQGLAGAFEWIGVGAKPWPKQDSSATSNSSTAATASGAPSLGAKVQSIALNAWLAKGIMWAQLTGHLSSEQRFELADGNADDPRCEDGRRLKVSVDHPLGKLSAQQVIKALQTYSDYLLQWDGQEPQPLRLAAISPPREVCIDIDAQQGPSAALNMTVRMTFVDDKQQRALTLEPHVRANLGLSNQEQLNLSLQYRAFNRGGESLPDFLTRHGVTPASANAPQSGIFELSLQMSNLDHKTLSGSVALMHFAQAQDCPNTSSGHQKDPKCEALHGTTLRGGTLVGTQTDTSL